MSQMMLHPAAMAAAQATHQFPMHDVNEIPMSRTHQYRKVMKPLLERKRRARINKCLDEMKDIMVVALQHEGESITKLEKADVLELTVRHLEKLKRHNLLQANPAAAADRFHSGFSACASEVSKFLSSVPGVDVTIGTSLMSHLGIKSNEIRQARLAAPLTVTVPLSSSTSCSSTTPSAAPVSSFTACGIISASSASDGGYSSGRDSVSPRSDASTPPPTAIIKMEDTTEAKAPVWRPF
jgi:hairy-and-enhancer-of-split protein